MTPIEVITALKAIRNLIMDDTDKWLEEDEPMPYFTIEYHGVKVSLPSELAPINEYITDFVDETIDFIEDTYGEERRE